MTGVNNTSSRSSRVSQHKFSCVESVEIHNDIGRKHRPTARSSRRGRVYPEQSRQLAMDGSDSSRRLRVDVNGYVEERQYTPSSGARNSRDLRSPGAKKTPVAVTAKAMPDGHPIPDFITQTDANGNPTTPRSASAIHGARSSHPGALKPNLHVDKCRHRPEDDSDDSDDGRLQVSRDDPCEVLLETFRLMCCCFIEESKAKSPKLLTGKVTEESDDRPRLLGDLHPDDKGKKCLVLDLDETLVHSSFRAVPNADFVIPVQIEDVVHFVYVIKRPGVDEFLIEMAKHYEIVIYTASLNKYADPLLDLLDPKRVIRTRLFRESCVYYEGNYVKDLSLLDRDLRDTIIIDNSPNSYLFHPENAIDCSSFIDDPRDRELDQIGAFLKGIKNVSDVRGIAPQWREWPEIELNDHVESR